MLPEGRSIPGKQDGCYETSWGFIGVQIIDIVRLIESDASRNAIEPCVTPHPVSNNINGAGTVTAHPQSTDHLMVGVQRYTPPNVMMPPTTNVSGFVNARHIWW